MTAVVLVFVFGFSAACCLLLLLLLLWLLTTILLFLQLLLSLMVVVADNMLGSLFACWIVGGVTVVIFRLILFV